MSVEPAVKMMLSQDGEDSWCVSDLRGCFEVGNLAESTVTWRPNAQPPRHARPILPYCSSTGNPGYRLLGLL